MHPSVDMNMLVLSAVCVADADGEPMTAGDIAFLLELPRKAIEACLRDLVADGSIRRDGERYRTNGALSAPHLARMEYLSDRIRELWPEVDDAPVRLDS